MNDTGNYRGKRAKRTLAPVRKAVDRVIDVEQMYADRRAIRNRQHDDDTLAVFAAIMGIIPPSHGNVK